MLISIGTNKFQGMLSNASYYAVDKTLINNFDYDEVFYIEKDDNKNVKMIISNAYKINSLTGKIAESVSYYLELECSKGVPVPLGVFTGISFISGYGKKINVPIITVSSVKCDIISDFSSGGINQTKHSVYLKIKPEVYVVTKFKTKKLNDEVSVLIYENVIVGDIPEVYLASTTYSCVKRV